MGTTKTVKSSIFVSSERYLRDLNMKKRYLPKSKWVKKYTFLEDLSGRSGDRTYLVEDLSGKKFIFKIVGKDHKFEPYINKVLQENIPFAVPKIYKYGVTDYQTFGKGSQRPKVLYYMVLEFLEKYRSMDQLLNENFFSDLTVKQIKGILFQILFIFYSLKSINFSHNDLKPEHILIDPSKTVRMTFQIDSVKFKLSTYRVKIIDFGHVVTSIKNPSFFDKIHKYFLNEVHKFFFTKSFTNKKVREYIRDLITLRYDLDIWHIMRLFLEVQNEKMEPDLTLKCLDFYDCIMSSYFSVLR